MVMERTSIVMTNPKTRTAEVCGTESGQEPRVGKRGLGSAVFCALFGGFLGLALLKFGNPVIAETWPEMNLPGLSVESGASTPRNVYEILLSPSWPMAWGYWGVAAMVVAGIASVGKSVKCQVAGGRMQRWFAAVPLGWLVWEVVAASGTVDRGLTEVTLAHFA